jgi:hypothetical protein
MSNDTTIIVCPECGAERSSDKGVRPGMTVRCHECRTSFIPISLLDEDDAPLPPPPLPGKGPARTSLKPRELHGRSFQRFEDSRRSTFIVGGIIVGGLIGLCASWYSWMVSGGIVENANKAQKKMAKKVETVAAADGSKAELPTLDKKFSGRLKPGETGKDTSAVPPRSEAKPSPPDLFSAQAGKDAFNRRFANATPPPAGPPPLAAQPQGPAPEKTAKKADSAQERKAASLLQQARQLDQEGRFLKSADLYRQILSSYPDTASADSVRKTVGDTVDITLAKAKTAFFQAQKTENAGKLADAKTKYEEVVSQYPDTEPAKSAKERLAEIAKKLR